MFGTGEFFRGYFTSSCGGILTIVLMLVPAFGQDGSMKWSFETGGGVLSSPAIGDDGIIYVGSSDHLLYAIQPDGTEKWRFDTGDIVEQPPVIAEDGTVYVPSNNGKVFALNPDGTLQWTFDSGLDADVTGEMALAADGTLYVGIGTATSSTVYAINPDGSQYWTFDPATTTRGIVVGAGGVVVFADPNGQLYVVNPDGTLRWQVDVGPGTNAPVVFGDDGTIYYCAGSAADSFFALSPDDGTKKWSVQIGRINESASTGENGDIYVPVAQGATEGGLIALDPQDGSEKWRFDVGGRVNTSPAVGFDGTIYFGTDTDEFFALGPNGNELWSFTAAGDIKSSPTIAPDGTVLFGSSDKKLYALNGSSTGLAPSSWPKKQRDVRNTGQFGSDVTRRRFFAPHVYWLDDNNKTTVTISHIGGAAGVPTGTTASFRIDVLNRDGTVRFSIEDSLEPGETKDIDLEPPDLQGYAGSAVIDAPVKDGSFLAPFLTWQLDVSDKLKPLKIGAFFSDPADAALVHFFPAEASQTVGLGIAVQNIGDNAIGCKLEFFNADGSRQAEEMLDLARLGSVVDFFNDSVPEGFRGKAAFQCDAPVVAVAVTQDFANGGFPTDRITIKGRN